MKRPTLLVQLGLSSLLMSALAGAAPAPPAKPEIRRGVPTICGITINSDDEFETFKKYIGEGNANFVELTKLEEPEDENPNKKTDVEKAEDSSRVPWLRLACKKRIKCDVLIISGHFGGSFFGSSGHSLTMEDLESMSCDDRCDGVLQNPKEVYLMGCNTLAGKKKDHRTPEEYRRVLIRDGFTPQQAEQVVAFRYSPLGDSFNERMRRVFRGTPRIYGFDSVGPSGKTVKPLLVKYFKTIKPGVYYTPKSLAKLDDKHNTPFLAALKGQAILQVNGVKDLKKEQIPACFLHNDKVAFFNKLNWIQKSLNGDDSFQYLPTINAWLSRMTAQNYQWRDKEFEVLEQVTYNTALRDRLAGIVKARDTAILGEQLKLLTFMKFFGWILPKDYMARVESLLVGDLSVAFDIERKDQICSYARSNNLKVDLDPSMIPAARWTDENFMQTLPCIANYNEKLMLKALKVYMSFPQQASNLASAYFQFLRGLKIPDESAQEFFNMIFPEGEKPLTANQTNLLCTPAYYGTHRQPRLPVPALSALHGTNPKYVEHAGCYVKASRQVIADFLSIAAMSPELREAAAKGLEALSRSPDLHIDEVSQLAIYERMWTEQDQNLKSSFISLLSNMKNMSSEVQDKLLAYLEKAVTERLLSSTLKIEEIVAKAMPKSQYCANLMARAEKSAAAEQIETSASAIERFTQVCLTTDYAVPEAYGARYDALSLKILKLLADNPDLPPYHEGSAYEGISSVNPIDFVGMIQTRKPKLTTHLAYGLMKINGHTHQGRMGSVMKDKEIVAMLPREALVADLLKDLKSGDKKLITRAEAFMLEVPLGRPEITQSLAERYKKMTEKDEKRYTVFNTLVTQDARAAAAAWLEMYAKLDKAQRKEEYTFSRAVFGYDGAIFAVLSEALAKKKIGEDVAAGVIAKIAGSTGRDGAKYKARFEELRKKFPGSKIIAKAIEAAAAQMRANERECDEFPRACEDHNE